MYLFTEPLVFPFKTHSAHLFLVTPSRCLFPSLCPFLLVPPILSILPHPPDRSGSFDRGCDTHSVYSSYLFRADRPDLPHPAHDGGSNPGQHGGSGPAALTVRLHHSGQKAAIPAGTRLWTHEVCANRFFVFRGAGALSLQLVVLYS